MGGNLSIVIDWDLARAFGRAHGVGGYVVVSECML